MSETYNTSSCRSNGKIRWKRDEVASTIIDFESFRHKQSQRQFAKEQGVPRTSLQHWLARRDSIDGSVVVRDFFESPDGIAFLHRLVAAAHFEFTKNGAASIHNVSNFLDMCGLSPSSDCFHVSHEIGKGTSGALAAEVKKREKEYEVAVKETGTQICLKDRYDSQPETPRGRRPQFEKRIDTALYKQGQAEAALTQARQNQEAVRTARAEIGNVYHPYELQTGKKQTPEVVSKQLESCFQCIDNAIEGLSDRCKKRVENAHRVVSKMVLNVVFFFKMIELYMDNMQISERERQLMHNYLIPGFYLGQAAGKEKDIERKARLLEKSNEMLTILHEPNGPLAGYGHGDIKRLEEAAKQSIWCLSSFFDTQLPACHDKN